MTEQITNTTTLTAFNCSTVWMPALCAAAITTVGAPARWAFQPLPSTIRRWRRRARRGAVSVVVLVICSVIGVLLGG